VKTPDNKNKLNESEISANEKHKDTVFKKLFGETDKLIPLYNALSGSNYPLDTHIEITTLENILFKGRYNDLSFIVDDKLVVLIEHQSTINPNMPLRLLIYLARVYDSYIQRIKKVYSTELVKIPRPEFIVLYNGVHDYPDESEMKLSDAFEKLPKGITQSGSLELKTRVLNINKGHNKNVVSKDRVLEEYSEFIDVIRKNQAAGMNMDEAIKAAVKDCVEKKILAEFLEKHGSEVISMLYAEWNLDEYVAVQRREAEEKGIEKTARKMFAKGYKLADIREITGINPEVLKKLQAEVESEKTAGGKIAERLVNATERKGKANAPGKSPAKRKKKDAEL